MKFCKVFIILSYFLAIHNVFTFDFIDKNLNDFVERVVDFEFRKEFFDYYATFIKNTDQLGKNNPSKKKHELSRIRNLALRNLENNDPEWALQIKPYLHATAENNEQKALIDTFLVRYGAYQEFLKKVAKQRASMWYRVKSYSRHLSSKMVNFFIGSKDCKEPVSA